MASLLFQPIELPGASWTRWATSLLIHAVILVLLIAIPVTVHQALQMNHPESVVTLVEPLPYVPTRPVVHLKQPSLQKVVRPAPAAVILFRAPQQPIVQQKTVAIQAPPMVEAPRLPEAVKLEVPKINLPAAAPAAARPEAVLPKVKVGGFGDPDGVQSSPAATSKGLTAAKIGTFDMSPGSAQGKGIGGGAGKVAVGGFGASSAGTGAGGNGNGGKVAIGGFGGVAAGTGSGGGNNGREGISLGAFGQIEKASVTRVAAPATRLETPVEIISKPKPAYTAEAREKGIEGEVLLEVLFSASGQIRVLRLERGLGFGLDESARAAASQIRFHPGTRDGNPVDMKGTIHIVFAIS
jgi:TonB family protein